MMLGEKRSREAAAVLVERFVNRAGGDSYGRAVYKDEKMHYRDREPLFAALVKTGEPAIEMLIPVASYGWQIRKQAADIVTRSGDVAVPHLLKAWEKGKDRETRRGAAKVLALLKPHEAILPLLKGMEASRYQGATSDGWSALAAYDADALPVFQRALNDPALAKHQRKAAAVMCAHFGDMSGWAMLEQSVTKGNSAEMNWTCSQMGHLHNETFLPLIGKALARKDAGQSVTLMAAFCGGKKSIPMLTKALKHPNPAVQSGAVSCLKMLSKNK